MPRTYAPRTIDKALAVLDGVVTISGNEMLIHGTYVSGVTRPDLAAKGSICGGRQACLIGSVALAATPTGGHHRELLHALKGYSGARGLKPFERLAIDALDDEATAILRGKRQTAKVRDAFDWDHVSEGYFERYLYGLKKPATHVEIVRLVEGARARVLEQARA